jgi:hypothetical protein
MPLHSFEPASARVLDMGLSADASTAVVCIEDGDTQVWHFDWELHSHDESVTRNAATWLRPHLEQFVQRHRTAGESLNPIEDEKEASAARILNRQGRPAWNDDDFNGLLETLSQLGLAILPASAVRTLLGEVARAVSPGAEG